jgi:alpha-beta hydrolase superfamily lysophospholipase
MEISWIDSDDGLGHKTKEFAFEKNRKVTGALWFPQETTKTLICLGHGASGDRYQAPLSYLAGRFVAAGYPCLSIDGPVHGLRSVGDGGRGAFFPDFQREESVIEMVEDWNDSVMVATELIGDCKLAYFGLSMGSIFGIPFVASRSDVVVSTLGLLGVVDQFPHGDEILRAAEKVSCPVLYLMQMEDELFNRDGYLRVFDALATKDKRLHANPGLHPEVPDEEVLFAFQFMRDVIEGHYDPGKALGLDA